MGIPSTGKDFAKHLSMLDKENTLEVMRIYQDKYGKPLDIAIKEEKLPDEVKNAVLDKMEDCLKKKYNYSDDFETTSQIENKYYTGSAYDVVQDGDTMTITNKDDGKETVINIEKLTKDLPLEQKIKFKQVLQTIPAEVIIDMYNEDNIDYSDKINRAFYRPANDSVNIGNYAINMRTLVHETGHALDYGDVAGIINLSMAQDNFGIMAMYNKELQAFIDAGNVKYDERGGRENPKIIGEVKNYVTWNICEMVAETYCLLMLGDTTCRECIENYFPQTMNIIKNLIRVRRDPNLIINMYWS